MFGYFNDGNFGVENQYSYGTDDSNSDEYSIYYQQQQQQQQQQPPPPQASNVNEGVSFDRSLNSFNFSISHQLSPQPQSQPQSQQQQQPYGISQEPLLMNGQSYPLQYQQQQQQQIPQIPQQQVFRYGIPLKPQSSEIDNQIIIPQAQQMHQQAPLPPPISHIQPHHQQRQSRKQQSQQSQQSQPTIVSKEMEANVTIPPITYEDKSSDNSLTPEQLSTSGGSPGGKVVPLETYIIHKGDKTAWESQRIALINAYFPGGLPLPAILNDGKFAENLIRLRRHKMSTLVDDANVKTDEVNSLERLILRIPHKTLVCMSIEGFSAYETYLNTNFVLNYNQKSELKYQKTLIRNREAVRETRKKSVTKISQLQTKVLELENTINGLVDENKYLKEQNMTLITQNELLRKMILSKPQQNSSSNTLDSALSAVSGVPVSSLSSGMVPGQCNLPEIVSGGCGLKREIGVPEEKESVDSNNNNDIIGSNENNSDDENDYMGAYRNAKKQKIALNYVCIFFAFVGIIIKTFWMSPIANVYEIYGKTRIIDMQHNAQTDGGRRLLAEGENVDHNLANYNMVIDIRKLFVGFVVTPFVVLFLLAGKKLSYKQIHKNKK